MLNWNIEKGAISPLDYLKENDTGTSYLVNRETIKILNRIDLKRENDNRKRTKCFKRNNT